MQDGLDVYIQPYAPARPPVCLDQTSRQVLADVRSPLLPPPGQPGRYDPEYVRGGVGNRFLSSEPLRCWRQDRVSAQWTRLDWPPGVKVLVNLHYPDAEQVVLVRDALNTHSLASLYAAFPPVATKRLADRSITPIPPSTAAG